MKEYSKNVQLVLDILQDEVNGDIESARQKMSDDYSMTWVESGIDGNNLFRHTSTDIQEEMKEVYPIKGRQYDIRNIAESDNLVIVELIESYPDSESGKEFRTPLVLVLEIENGKIKTGRHYLDPRLSYKYLSRDEVEAIYRKSSLFIIK